MSGVDAAQHPDALGGTGIPYPATQCVARIGRVRDHATVPQYRRRTTHESWLGVDGMNLQQLRHDRSVSGSYNRSRRRCDRNVNLQQLKYLCAVVDNGLNVSAAAEALYTSQPGISKQIRQLEDELGLRIFVRQGKRLTSLTPAGDVVVGTARRALREIGNLKRVADEFRSEDTGVLGIATTHTQARYVLPQVLSRFAARFPKVRLVLHQGNPVQVAIQTSAGDVDVGIATEALVEHPQLITLPCYQWNRGVLVPNGHPLIGVRPLTLEALARYPIITYDFSFTGRSAINAAFTARGLEPNVVLTALDADVIKTYVETGMGVGIVASMAYDARKDAGFALLDASHLFAASTTRLALRKGVFLRGFVYDFITLFAPQYTRSAIDTALADTAPDDLM
jgi:LysR family cys regulon transcriptional activator